MNRKIMDGLSYGFYFIVLCLVFLVVYLIFFKDDTPKNNITNDPDNSETNVVNENIKLNKDKISLDIGGGFDLKVTLIPSSGDEVINYESSDSAVATVDENGKILAVGEGSAIITASVEGTNLKAECEVIVSNVVIIPTGVFVNKTHVELGLNETYQINATVTPNNAVDKSLVFSSTNDKVATVNENGLVTTLKQGSTKINVKSVANPEVQINIQIIVQ